MFRSRRSFKVAPGVRINTGKRGVTSVNVAGVRLGSTSGRRSGGSRKPTKAQQQAEFWRMKPGLWYARFNTGDGDFLNLEVRGSELTYDRVLKMSTAATEKNADAEARIFRQFIASWDLENEKGGDTEPISAVTLLKISSGFYYGLTIEIVNALGITKKRLNSVISNANTGKAYSVEVSDKPFLAPSINSTDVTDELDQDWSSGNFRVLPDTPDEPGKYGRGCAKKVLIWSVVLLLAVIVLAMLI